MSNFEATCHKAALFDIDSGHSCPQDMEPIWTAYGRKIPHQCDETFTDPDELRTHLKTLHGIKEVRTARHLEFGSVDQPSANHRPTIVRTIGSGYRVPRAPKTPKPFKPKPFTAGARIAYREFIPGRWTGGSRGEGTFVPPEHLMCEGTVWSEAPGARQLWVVPDNEPDTALVVKLPAASRVGREPPEVTGRPDYQGRLQRRNNIMAHGGLYPVIENVTTRRTRVTWYSTATTRIEYDYMWHAWPDCPRAVGKQQPEHKHSVNVYEAIARMENDAFGRGDKTCRICVHLDRPEADGSAC